jgi:hypothetical protein
MCNLSFFSNKRFFCYEKQLKYHHLNHYIKKNINFLVQINIINVIF